MHMLKKEHMGIYADGLGEVFDGNGNRQPAEDWIQRHPEIHNEKKKKKLWLVHLAKILLQQLIIVFSSLYVYHVPVCMPDKVEVYSKWGF